MYIPYYSASIIGLPQAHPYFGLKGLQKALCSYVVGGLIKEALDYKHTPTFAINM